MEVLTRRYYERLPKEISELAETKIVFGWLSRCPMSDIYTLISDLASDNDAAFQSWLFSKKENDDIKDFRVRKLFLKHFRKFDDLNEKSFLLNCENKDKVCSLFVTGKMVQVKQVSLLQWSICLHQVVPVQYYNEKSQTQAIFIPMEIDLIPTSRLMPY